MSIVIVCFVIHTFLIILRGSNNIDDYIPVLVTIWVTHSFPL